MHEFFVGGFPNTVGAERTGRITMGRAPAKAGLWTFASWAEGGGGVVTQSVTHSLLPARVSLL